MTPSLLAYVPVSIVSAGIIGCAVALCVARLRGHSDPNARMPKPPSVRTRPIER